MEHFDAIIIGFGKGGKTLALDLAARGEKVAMIERSAAMYGGTCINIACIPTKALIYRAKMAEYLPLKTFGEKAVFYRKSIREKNAITADLRQRNFDKLNAYPNAKIYTGLGSFLSPHQVEVTTEKNRFVVEGDRIFIDTGAEPVIPPISGIRESRRVYTSTSLMELDELPQRLVIIGGGYIGLEFASMFAGFGSKVVVLENKPAFLEHEDPVVADAVKRVMEKQGIEFRLNAEVDSIEDTDEVSIVGYQQTVDRSEHRLFADAILIATGRQASTESLNPGAAGVRTDAQGRIIVNEYLQTTAPHIWAMGDVKGGPQFTYVSLDDYRIVRDQLYGQGVRHTGDREPVVYSVYIDPPLSRIGMTEQQAIARGYEVMSKTIPVETIPRARVLGSTEGILKSVVDTRTGKILGCTMFCTDSHEVINTVALAMKAGMNYSFLRDRVYTHPSMSESFNELFSF